MSTNSSEDERKASDLLLKENSPHSRYIFLISGILVLTMLLVGGTTALMILSELDEEQKDQMQFDLDASLFCTEFENIFSRLNRRLMQLRAVLELSHRGHLPSDDDFYFEHPLTFTKWNKYVTQLADNNFPSTNVFIGWIPQVSLERCQVGRVHDLWSTSLGAREFYCI